MKGRVIAGQAERFKAAQPDRTQAFNDPHSIGSGAIQQEDFVEMGVMPVPTVGHFRCRHRPSEWKGFPFLPFPQTLFARLRASRNGASAVVREWRAVSVSMSGTRPAARAPANSMSIRPCACERSALRRSGSTRPIDMI